MLRDPSVRLRMRSLQRVLVTGATGYVGGRLVPRLLEAGYEVRALVRDVRRLQGRTWVERVDTVVGDVLKPETLPAAMAGVDVAFYLIHSMAENRDFHRRDLLAAHNFARAARSAGVRRVIYLGGLGDPSAVLSRHLRSRQETGHVLRQAGVPVTEFRAAIIVGSGSISFEIVRNLAERLPVMICPRWVYTRVQPIAIDDVIQYLIAALEVSESADWIIEIGGADVLTYAEMILTYARLRGLKRVLLPIPVLSPHLSSYWVHWVTPIHADIARPLIEGLRNEVVVRTDAARRLFPHIEPMGYEDAVRKALEGLAHGQVETSWTDALAASQVEGLLPVLKIEQGVIIEQRSQRVLASPRRVFEVFSGLGGERGWLWANWAWRLRGIFDRLIGGVGSRRGRRHPVQLRVGDVVDFWRVEEVVPDRKLRLRAEMKMPGSAWLQWEARSRSDGRTLLVQTAFFAPKGLLGLIYWYALYPIHRAIFSGLIRAIARRAEVLESHGRTTDQTFEWKPS